MIAGNIEPPARAVPLKNSFRAQRTTTLVLRTCPSCPRMLLLPKTHSGIEIDICPSCNGIWLDAGELDHILRRHHGIKKTKTGGGAVELAGDIAREAVFEFIGEIIGSILS